jgi:hypothetical protein
MSMKDDDLSYTLPDGRLIFTSEYFRRKKACCKSSCLHCPYGHTLKSLGLTFRQYQESDEALLKTLLSNNGFSVDYVSSMLSAASGMKQKKFDIEANANKIQMILLKEFVCGFGVVENGQLVQIFLGQHFKHQGLDLAVVQEYYKN